MDEERLEKISACALGKIFGYEPLFINEIISNLGNARKVFQLDKEELFEMFGPHSTHREKINDKALADAEKELLRLENQGMEFIACTDPLFPTLLRECPDCPAGLYLRSDSRPEDIFNKRPAIGIVGTRDISPYGEEWCPKIVEAISGAPSKPAVVSGLAIGVDISAHMAALAYGLPTIGVMPNGVDTVYPPRHRVAAEKIARSPGSALVTDYPPGTDAMPVTFLRRNRIIAGLSNALILVESRVKGGGMMTARLASEYGRLLMALPGRVEDARSGGCNALIHDKLAEAIGSLDTLGEDLGLGIYDRRKGKDFVAEVAAFYEGQKDAEDLIRAADIIKGNRNRSLDEIAEKKNLDIARLSYLARTLESDGFITLDLLQRCHIRLR